jgi:hypothetical protein
LGEKENQNQRTAGSGYFKKLQRSGSSLKRTGNKPVVVQAHLIFLKFLRTLVIYQELGLLVF